QEDLNSLGFEWILNSDYSLGLGSHVARALGIRGGRFNGDPIYRNTSTTSAATDGTTIGGTTVNTGDSTASPESTLVGYAKSNGASWIRSGSARHGKIGVNGIGGEGATYQTGMRYLSTLSNHISGESASNNDQFMRLNAFLGGADLSMILHMLSQRSDTDLLSAPKVLTRPGEEAVMKVVTEYIYPTDYDVQLQSSNSGGGGYGGGGSQSAILAVVEPQSFTMREVGVILDVTPTYSEANGGTIDLELKPQVVDEPIWHNYGMKIPFSGNSSQLSIGNLGAGPFPDHPPSEDVINRITESYWNAVANFFNSIGGSGNMTWYDAPMEQPFFHVRMIDSKVSITPGATVVMGGLITESRKAMDDKIPFLGDLPYVGRLFRSHAEQTIKRNLLIFVTGRLITPSGRELHMNEEASVEAEVKSAPEKE
ncbi:MAG: hypothetical protein J6V72_15610, partial [Kiritimatiellae bacterium]|nr:hypothetical protein [Kiritimatiellia bacterium]